MHIPIWLHRLVSNRLKHRVASKFRRIDQEQYTFDKPGLMNAVHLQILSCAALYGAMHFNYAS